MQESGTTPRARQKKGHELQSRTEAVDPDHGPEDGNLRSRDQLGEVPQGDGGAEGSGEALGRGPERCLGVGDKSAGPGVWKLPGQETFPSAAVLSGSVWSPAELLGVGLQHLCQQPPLPVQVRARTAPLI